MIQALLHGKLTFKQENMEDILTSNVFGLFRYVRPECGLFQFLAKAKTIDGNCPLANLPSQSDHRSLEYDFWPQWDNCIPDVALSIPGVPHYLVAVEAKYLSGKSSRAVEPNEDEVRDEADNDEHWEEELEVDESAICPSDQLAKEWTDLVIKASEIRAQPVLVYLTAHLHYPKKELADSIRDCNRLRTGAPAPPMICWLTWRELPRLFRGSLDLHLADLARLAEKMGLTLFEGISKLTPISVNWTFRKTTRPHGISSIDAGGDYGTCHNPKWQFDLAPIACDWRFRR